MSVWQPGWPCDDDITYWLHLFIWMLYIYVYSVISYALFMLITFHVVPWYSDVRLLQMRDKNDPKTIIYYSTTT